DSGNSGCARWKARCVSAENGTVVVVEDDPHIADLVDLYLRREGFRVLLAADGEKGLDLFKREEPWIVILDVGLPGHRDGFDVCREIRSRSKVPVLFLTARDDEVDRILGLELGADDYLVKPFSPRELVARVRAILRRTREGPAPQEVVTVGDVEVDLRRRETRQGGQAVALTTREFDLLAFLANNLGLALSRQQLLDGVWGTDWYGDERTVDVHVAQLRKKLGSELPLATVWGVGYRFG
ncbi:MAG TPA: response regulator transcription factor, partial [Acidimicrobiales bacterium]|nr:response regulator transcription factor [Acidimicrobiales bacterium]